MLFSFPYDDKFFKCTVEGLIFSCFKATNFRCTLLFLHYFAAKRKTHTFVSWTLCTESLEGLRFCFAKRTEIETMAKNNRWNINGQRELRLELEVKWVENGKMELGGLGKLRAEPNLQLSAAESAVNKPQGITCTLGKRSGKWKT